MTGRAVGVVDDVALDMVASHLDLRVPNKRAVKTIALRVGEHEASGADGVFEGVIDAAVGMGKTYIMAAAMDYFAAADGIRNFAIITPGSTILQKTKSNFTRYHPKSLLPGLAVHPVVITSENFNTPAMRAVMDDPAAVKLYIFTVQSLLKPTTKVGRRTHKFQEGLGRGFYEQLRGLGDLMVFADEHHVYDAPKFSDAVRDLSPRALIGLTGTPTKKMKPRIIYRFPLAAAIAEEYVKTPVIVGRRDDLDDTQTKLRDGVQLLDLKQQAVDEFAEREAVDTVNAVMLVVAQSIQEAQAYAATPRIRVVCWREVRRAGSRNPLEVAGKGPGGTRSCGESGFARANHRRGGQAQGRLGRQERLRDRFDAGVDLQDPHGADAWPRSPPPLRTLHWGRVSGHP